MKKIGIVGTGETVGIAHFHAQGIGRDPRATVAAVYDLNREAAGRFVREHGFSAAVCESYAQMLSLVDAAIICTPNSTHIPYVLETIEAGRAVFVEKPLSISPESCAPVLALLERQPVVNMTGFIYRYAFQMQALKRLVADHIGRVYTYSATFGGKRLADPSLPLEWRMRRALSGAGALGDFGSHLIDNACYTADLRFDDLQAAVQTFIPRRPADKQGNTQVENDDAAALQGIAENGALASFLVSRVGMDEINVLITGEGGMARAALRENQPVLFWPKRPDGGYTGEGVQIDLPPQVYFDGWFYEEDKAFISALLGEPPAELADIPHGYYVETLLHGAETSAQTASPSR